MTTGGGVRDGKRKCGAYSILTSWIQVPARRVEGCLLLHQVCYHEVQVEETIQLLFSNPTTIPIL
jgi:hypothetical protein